MGFAGKKLSALIAVLALAGVLTLGACSSESESSASPTTTEETASPTTSAAEKDIVDTAVDAGSFTKLVAALQAAGLDEALRGEGPFTVFAPTDAAFDALPDGTLNTLLADPEGDLTDILKYHVVSGEVMAADITDGMMATTLEGSDITLTIQDGKVYVNDAQVVTADIMTSNGVIHVIDKVLIP